MRAGWLAFLILVVVWFSPISGQDTSCLDTFRDLDSLKPVVNPTERVGMSDYPIMAWYGQCILVGSGSGLWLYDPEQPEHPLQLAEIEDRAINYIAVNPINQTIAFNIAEEPVVYRIHSDSTVSALEADGQAVTAITFSHDGNLIAVASSDVESEYGFHYDARMQIWNGEGDIVSSIVPHGSQSRTGVIREIFFSTDDQHVLLRIADSGYLGDSVGYWDIDASAQVWNYYDGLLGNYQSWLPEDPLAVTSLTMKGDKVALGGVQGFFNDRNFSGLGVHLWNAATQERGVLIVPGNRTEELAYSMPDVLLEFNSNGAVLVTSLSDETTLSFWDTDDGHQIGKLDVQVEEVLQIAYSPDYRSLAVMTPDSIILFDPDSLKTVLAVNLWTPKFSDD